jgi:ParB family transcriptional regulator, chromosome partitioning protein
LTLHGTRLPNLRPSPQLSRFPGMVGIENVPPSQDLQELPLDLIDPNLSQPRRYFDEAALEGLATSIGERSVLQPVLVRPVENDRYQLVVGERRWRAAKLAGLETIPALVSDYEDLAALEAGLIENMAREDLNPVEEARACATLVNELGLTLEQVGQRVGRSRSAVSNLMRLLDLSAEILELLERGELSEGHGRALLTARDRESHRELARRAIEGGWSVRRLESRARESNGLGSVPNAALNDAGPASGQARGGHTQESSQQGAHEQAQDVTARNIAKVWGDALGAEVEVRHMRGSKLRVEFVFDSSEGALALGGQIAEKIARGTKRR